FSRNIAFNSGSPQALAVGSRDDFRKANDYVGNGSIPSNNIVLDSNRFYHPPGNQANIIQIGNGATNQNALITNNYMYRASGRVIWQKWSSDTFNGNVILGRNSRIYGVTNMIQATQTSGVGFSSYNWNNNTYYDPNSGNWYWAPTCSSGALMTFTGYRSCTG